MRRRTKITLSIVGGAAALALAGISTLMILNRPLSADEVDQAIGQRLQAAVDSEPTLSSALLTIYSAGDGRLREYAIGTTREGGHEPARADSRYHSASVGKTMLATIYGQLVDEGTVSLDDPVSSRLDEATLADLFVVDSIDHAEEVTFRQLLGHTSGVADYFKGPVTDGEPLLAQIAADPDLAFTPTDLLAFSRDHQKPVGVPGAQFSYSDTGYILLGLALEKIEQKPYDAILDERLFAPLGMTDSHLMTEFGVPSGILPLTLGGIDLSERNALSVDWAGGGVVTTMRDLLIFSRALHERDLVSDDSFAAMTDFTSEMDAGIHYGLGMVQFRFSELSPLLFSMSDLHGTVGATGTFALYDPAADTYFIANFGSLDYAQKAIEQLVEIRLLLQRETR